MSARGVKVRITTAWWLKPFLLGCLFLTWFSVNLRLASEQSAAEWLNGVLKRSVARAMTLTMCGTN